VSDPETITDMDWLLLVKRTREKFGVSIAGAHDLIFQDETMRRLVALRVNLHPKCRAIAFRDMRERGSDSNFILTDGKIRFRLWSAD
jgi:hypothetical protein